MKRVFLLKPAYSHINQMYLNHSTYHKGDSGLDLYVIENITIQPGETKLVDTGIKCQCRSFTLNPLKWIKGEFYNYHSYWSMARSSISKTPLILKNSIGLIDSAYTGNIKAPLYNTSSYPFTLRKGERYIQLVNGDLSPVQFELTATLRDTTRAEGGFGSTGL